MKPDSEHELPESPEPKFWDAGREDDALGKALRAVPIPFDLQSTLRSIADDASETVPELVSVESSRTGSRIGWTVGGLTVAATILLAISFAGWQTQTESVVDTARSPQVDRQEARVWESPDSASQTSSAADRQLEQLQMEMAAATNRRQEVIKQQQTMYQRRLATVSPVSEDYQTLAIREALAVGEQLGSDPKDLVSLRTWLANSGDLSKQ